jgi:hypothetical protein
MKKGCFIPESEIELKESGYSCNPENPGSGRQTGAFTHTNPRRIKEGAEGKG